MNKKGFATRELIIILFVVIMFSSISILSFTSIKQQQGNARVVNYVGIVRGATQKLVKNELQGYPDDAWIAQLDSIIDELLTGVGPNNLVVLEDNEYLGNLRRVETHWKQLKEEIFRVREGADSAKLYEDSETYFKLVNETVFSAEAFSEEQVNRSNRLLTGINIVFIAVFLLGLVYYIRTAALKKRAELLGKIAYVDPLAQMPNRASCEREMDALITNPPEENIAVLMFDMNNLKLVNDQLGHQGGDRVIADFARIIKTEAQDYGFICRYGGDEFLAIFQAADKAKVERYLTRINEKIVSYNLLHVNEVEKLSFAVGYEIGNLQDTTIEELVNEADRRMYIRKRQMKENKE